MNANIKFIFYYEMFLFVFICVYLQKKIFFCRAGIARHSLSYLLCFRRALPALQI